MRLCVGKRGDMLTYLTDNDSDDVLSLDIIHENGPAVAVTREDRVEIMVHSSNYTHSAVVTSVSADTPIEKIRQWTDRVGEYPQRYRTMLGML